MDQQVNNRLEGLSIVYDCYNGKQVGKFNGRNGDFHWGGEGIRGRIMVQDPENNTLFEFDAERNLLILRNREGQVTLSISGETGEIAHELPEDLAVVE